VINLGTERLGRSVIKIGRSVIKIMRIVSVPVEINLSPKDFRRKNGESAFWALVVVSRIKDQKVRLDE
jgi:hypothetical protein